MKKRMGIGLLLVLVLISAATGCTAVWDTGATEDKKQSGAPPAEEGFLDSIGRRYDEITSRSLGENLRQLPLDSMSLGQSFLRGIGAGYGKAAGATTMLLGMPAAAGLDLIRGDNAATDAVGPVEYFEVDARDGQIVLTPVRMQRGDAVRAKLAQLALSEADVAGAVAWARRAAPARDAARPPAARKRARP